MKSHSPLRIVSALLVLSALFWIARPAEADIAPPAPPNGAGIEPGSEVTNVRMVDEVVLIEVSANSLSETGSAAVTATFKMHNLGEKEERMDVRFPLYSAGYFDYGRSAHNYYFPPLENFTAWVNGKQAQVYNTYSTLEKNEKGTLVPETFPDWANFPVIFPPGQDVIISVKYMQTGYGGIGHFYIDNYVKYSYLLLTGASWRDTIGSADITIRLPMPANDMTVVLYEPHSVEISGNDINWHFNDFEPDQETQTDSIYAAILQPKFYFKIQDALKNTAAHPEDGKAWGQLGDAYQEAGTIANGFWSSPQGETIFRQSAGAYQKAVDLLPNNPDYRYGYANLLCKNAMWKLLDRGIDFPSQAYDGFRNTFTQFDKLPDQINNCIQQLKQALGLNPEHEGAKELLKDLAAWDWVDLSGAQPNYLILTPVTETRTSTPRPSQTRRPSITLVSSSTNTKTITPQVITITPVATPIPEQSKDPRIPPLLSLCGIIFVSSMIIVGLSFRIKKKMTNRK